MNGSGSDFKNKSCGRVPRLNPCLSLSWNEIVNFHALVRHGVISKDDLSLFHFVDSPTEALEALKRLKVESEKKCPAMAKSSTIGRGAQV